MIQNMPRIDCTRAVLLITAAWAALELVARDDGRRSGSRLPVEAALLLLLGGAACAVEAGQDAGHRRRVLWSSGFRRDAAPGVALGLVLPLLVLASRLVMRSDPGGVVSSLLPTYAEVMFWGGVVCSGASLLSLPSWHPSLFRSAAVLLGVTCVAGEREARQRFGGWRARARVCVCVCVTVSLPFMCLSFLLPDSVR
jgi:hypothetical protein